MKSPKCFISYSWDDDSHRSWVKDLAIRLRRDGIEVTLDQWHAVPGDQLPAFMETAIRDSDFVVVVCTPKYKDRADNRRGGVGYEGDVLTGEVFSGASRKKILPISRSGMWIDAAPSFCVGRYYLDFSTEEMASKNYLVLLQYMSGKLEQAPPVGRFPANVITEFNAQRERLALGKKWVGLEFKNLLLHPDTANVAANSLLTIADAVRFTFGDRAAMFTFAMRRFDLVDEATGRSAPCWSLTSHHRAFVRKVSELHEARIRKLHALLTSDLPKDEQRAHWIEAEEKTQADRAGWSYVRNVSLPGENFHAYSCTYEPLSKHMEVADCPMETDPAKYQHKLHLASEALAFACSLRPEGMNHLGDIVWSGTGKNYPLTKLMIRILDGGELDFADFRCELDNPESWDFMNPEFDTEIETSNVGR